MRYHATDLPGLMLIEPFSHEDERGSFVKTFHSAEFAQQGLRTDFRESFYSESAKGVIRGMHFQRPPHHHAKLVYCTAGEVVDVILDLRKDSPMYGLCQSFHLSATNRLMLYIPEGMAHGFCALSDHATLFYFTTCEHSKEHDTGIRYDSFGFEWPIENPVLSERDLGFIKLGDWKSVF